MPSIEDQLTDSDDPHKKACQKFAYACYASGHMRTERMWQNREWYWKQNELKTNKSCIIRDLKCLKKSIKKSHYLTFFHSLDKEMIRDIKQFICDIESSSSTQVIVKLLDKKHSLLQSKLLEPNTEKNASLQKYITGYLKILTEHQERLDPEPEPSHVRFHKLSRMD